jgi:hypothetical protein
MLPTKLLRQNSRVRYAFFPFLTGNSCQRTQSSGITIGVRGIIGKYKALLPLIFGKWSYFQKVKGEDAALQRLSAVANNQDLFEGGESLIPAATMGQRIYWFFYFIGLFPVRHVFDDWRIVKNHEAWSSWWYEDPDIRAFLSRELHAYQGRLRRLMFFVERHIAIIDGPRKHKRTK